LPIFDPLENSFTFSKTEFLQTKKKKSSPRSE